MLEKKYGIIGGGIAGLSLASFLNEKVVLFEKESNFGGLSRSYRFNDIDYDIGPHIIFSKNKQVLDLHTKMIPVNSLRRSNKVFFKGRYIKYPFENDLSSLSQNDRDYCLNEFLNNPYEQYEPNNMLQFFLKTFGEGITRLYLQPYNEKIWKFDSSCLDTQMVERIPKPPREDVIASANGVSTEGYVHQLNFYYPTKGGFQSLINSYKEKSLVKENTLLSHVNIESLKKVDGIWEIHTNVGTWRVKTLINCIPIHELFKYLSPPDEILSTLSKLLYNSIYIVVVKVKKDSIGNNFALYVPDKDIIFHRVSKLNYLGEEYCPKDGSSNLMAEVTFRPESEISKLTENKIKEMVINDLCKCGFINLEDVQDVSIKMEKYAYVIYDLDHRKNVDKILDYLRSINIHCVGRFAEFEYLNTDGVVEHTLILADKLNAEQNKF